MKADDISSSPLTPRADDLVPAPSPAVPLAFEGVGGGVEIVSAASEHPAPKTGDRAPSARPALDLDQNPSPNLKIFSPEMSAGKSAPRPVQTARRFLVQSRGSW